MRYHFATSIEGLLNLSDRHLKNMLWSVTDENGEHPESVQDFRKYLNEELAQGHRILPAPGCDNFDPVKGCLGHPASDKKE